MLIRQDGKCASGCCVSLNRLSPCCNVPAHVGPHLVRKLKTRHAVELTRDGPHLRQRRPCGRHGAAPVGGVAAPVSTTLAMPPPNCGTSSSGTALRCIRPEANAAGAPTKHRHRSRTKCLSPGRGVGPRRREFATQRRNERHPISRTLALGNQELPAVPTVSPPTVSPPTVTPPAVSPPAFAAGRTTLPRIAIWAFRLLRLRRRRHRHWRHRCRWHRRHTRHRQRSVQGASGAPLVWARRVPWGAALAGAQTPPARGGGLRAQICEPRR